MKKIMLVDDEMHVLRILRLSLEKQGYEVETFSNGEDAMDALRKNQPDVLVTDIQMPRMSGEELCKNIRIEFPERAFLIIVLTSRAEIEHREWSASFDNLEFVEKPVSMRQLITQLEDYFLHQNI
jgi:CheY-like chemotaxis protein